MPAGRQGISKAGRSTHGKVRGLRTGASFPQDIMAARRERVARASQALGKGKHMEITYSRNVNYSLELDTKRKRELADHLDITLRELNKLVEAGELYDEHGDELIDWIDRQVDQGSISGEEDIEIEDITA